LNTPRQLRGNRRPLALLSIAIALLLFVAVWSYGVLASSRQAALDASADLSTCMKLAGRIQASKNKPSLIGTHDLQATELTKRIEGAATRAGIPAERLVRVWPEQARRVGNSPHKETPTQALLRGVSIQQAVTLLHALSSGEENVDSGGLQVRSLRFIAPREGERSEGWTVETTVSYLVYSPASEESSREFAF
jgi:hypothetical protein